MNARKNLIAGQNIALENYDLHVLVIPDRMPLTSH